MSEFPILHYKTPSMPGIWPRPTALYVSFLISIIYIYSPYYQQFRILPNIMSKSSKSDLFQLIKTLTKAEKRHFRLFIQRQNASDEKLYVRLFDAMDRLKEFDDNKLSIKLPDISGRRLINLKRHLHEVLLKSLRLLHTI